MEQAARTGVPDLDELVAGVMKLLDANAQQQQVSDALKAEIAQLTAERDARREEIRQDVAYHQVIKDNVSMVEAETEQKKAELTVLQEQCTALQQRADNLHKELESLRAELSSAWARPSVGTR